MIDQRQLIRTSNHVTSEGQGKENGRIGHSRRGKGESTKGTKEKKVEQTMYNEAHRDSIARKRVPRPPRARSSRTLEIRQKKWHRGESGGTFRAISRLQELERIPELVQHENASRVTYPPSFTVFECDCGPWQGQVQRLENDPKTSKFG